MRGALRVRIAARSVGSAVRYGRDSRSRAVPSGAAVGTGSVRGGRGCVQRVRGRGAAGRDGGTGRLVEGRRRRGAGASFAVGLRAGAVVRPRLTRRCVVAGAPWGPTGVSSGDVRRPPAVSDRLWPRAKPCCAPSRVWAGGGEASRVFPLAVQCP